MLEVHNKWDQIDDEIWAKIICMEKNRRVAKTYARLPYLIVDGSNFGFDGIRLGLKGFENVHRSEKTKEMLDSIGEVSFYCLTIIYSSKNPHR